MVPLLRDDFRSRISAESGVPFRSCADDRVHASSKTRNRSGRPAPRGPARGARSDDPRITSVQGGFHQSAGRMGSPDRGARRRLRSDEQPRSPRADTPERGRAGHDDGACHGLPVALGQRRRARCRAELAGGVLRIADGRFSHARRASLHRAQPCRCGNRKAGNGLALVERGMACGTRTSPEYRHDRLPAQSDGAARMAQTPRGSPDGRRLQGHTRGRPIRRSAGR